MIIFCWTIEKTDVASQYKLTAAGRLEKMTRVSIGPTIIIIRFISSASGAGHACFFGRGSLTCIYCATAAAITTKKLAVSIPWDFRFIKFKKVSFNVPGAGMNE